MLKLIKAGFFMIKTNKKYVLLTIAIAFLLFLCVLASACGTSKPTPWNKTLTFSSLSDIDIICVKIVAKILWFNNLFKIQYKKAEKLKMRIP